MAEGSTSDCNGVAFVIGLVILIVLDVIKFIVGCTYASDTDSTESQVCPLMEHVPLYLIVSARAPWYFYKKVLSATGCICIIMFIAYVVFYFIWLICGSVWIYSNCKAVIVDDTHPDCNKALMGFAAFVVTVDWIYAITISCLSCALMCK